MDYECVIGLEVHAQLLTDSKLFCSCATTFQADPNDQTCPVCLGLPGVLPVLNRQAVELTMRTGLAMHGTVAGMNRFARKNYFYPDLPKGYQIFAVRGTAHPGRLPGYRGWWRHPPGASEPHPPRRGRRQVHPRGKPRRPQQELRRSEPHRRAADGDRQRPRPAVAGRWPGPTCKSSRRCWNTWTCATATWKKAACAATPTSPCARWVPTPWARETEIKNLNSFRNVQQAIAYEVERQGDVLDGGGSVVQETRLFDAGPRCHPAHAQQGRGARLPLLPGAGPGAAANRAGVD